MTTPGTSKTGTNLTDADAPTRTAPGSPSAAASVAISEHRRALEPPALCARGPSDGDVGVEAPWPTGDPDADRLLATTWEWISRPRSRWWVVHTRARHEKVVACSLNRQHVRHYLPLVDVHHTYAKSQMTSHVPLFPGYLFLCGNHDDREKAWKTNRVANILDVADQDRFRHELAQVYRVVESGNAVELYPALQVGQRCRISAGPLKGSEGVVIRHGPRCRMYLSVTILGQSAVVEIDAALLEAIG